MQRLAGLKRRARLLFFSSSMVALLLILGYFSPGSPLIASVFTVVFLMDFILFLAMIGVGKRTREDARMRQVASEFLTSTATGETPPTLETAAEMKTLRGSGIFGKRRIQFTMVGLRVYPEGPSRGEPALFPFAGLLAVRRSRSHPRLTSAYVTALFLLGALSAAFLPSTGNPPLGSALLALFWFLGIVSLYYLATDYFTLTWIYAGSAKEIRDINQRIVKQALGFAKYRVPEADYSQA